MLPADGVAAPEDLLVGRPVLADLVLQLLLYGPQGLAFDAAEFGGFVLYAEKEGVLVFDG